MTAPLLTMTGISKTFGPVRALRQVELSVWPGEIHALMGENGAGKSTLMKILAGALRADSGGQISIDGVPADITSPAKARDYGIAVIYQELSLAPNLTVLENVGLGHETNRGGLIDRQAMRKKCRDVLDRLSVDFTPDTPVSALSMAQRQLVEIARALALDARILIMDEPTTALSSRETDKLFDLVRTLRQDGMAIIYISHRMAEVYELADRCSVLRDGAYVGTLAKDQLSAEVLVKMMVGRDMAEFYHKTANPIDRSVTPRLSVRDLGDGDRYGPYSFDVFPGEVLGLAGLVGSGRTECARLIYGADTARSGTVWVDGKPVAITDPSQAIGAGVVYLTEDRKGQGLFLDMSIADNIDISVAGRDARGGGIRRLNKAATRARDIIKRLAIRAPSEKAMVGGLSGGNQQKVLIGRLLETRPAVLILDEPTRGVDIGAKSDIYELIDELTRGGAAVVLISSELPEVVGLADRVLVIADGHVAGEVEGSAITQETVMDIATGDAGRLKRSA